MNCILTKNLNVQYREVKILENINLEIPSYVLSAIVGPNGAGKSTLLKSILNLVEHDGNVQFWGNSFEIERKKIAYIPQRSLIDWDFPATVMDLVLMGLYAQKGVFGRINKSEKNLALEALDRVGLIDYRTRQISQLSGGQQQRVFIARALVQNPDLYLLDEPFAGVDVQSEALILQILKDLVLKKKTVLVVHHNLETVKEYFDHIVLLNKKIIAQGSLQTQFTSQNLKSTYGFFIPSI